jgi:hypothetical protein
MWMTKPGAIVLLVLAVMLTGCGTYVPGIPEFALEASTQRLVQVILDSIHCEIKNSIQWVVRKDIEYAEIKAIAEGAPPYDRERYRSAKWFDDWGLQGALTLTIKETTTFNPTITGIFPPFFKLGAGLNGSAQATRSEVLNFYYNVYDLAYKETSCKFPIEEDHPIGSLLINSNLGLREWLESIILAVQAKSTQLLVDQGITHTVEFQIVSSADITPNWNFPSIMINASPKLLSGMRDRLHELLVTLGPVDKEKKLLVGPAAGQFLAGQIGSAISNRVTVVGPTVVVP